MTHPNFEGRKWRDFLREQAETVNFRLRTVELEVSERRPESVISGIDEARTLLERALAIIGSDQPLKKVHLDRAASQVSLAAIWTGVAIGDIRSRNKVSDFLDRVLPSE